MMKTPTLAPRKAPRQQRSQATVDAILDATARVLVERGIGALNTNLVAERAGVSVGSLYQYFPNKLALVGALHERHARAMRAALEAVFTPRQGESLRAALTRVIAASIEAHRVDADLHRALQQCEEMGVPQHDHDEAHARIAELVVELLSAYRSEVRRPDLKLAAFTLTHALHATVHAAVLDPPPDLDLAAATEEMLRLAESYLTAA